MTGANPHVFKSLRIISGGKEGLYVVGAMFTDAYSAKAERLVASCERFGLQYAVHEVPSVHKSISDRGTEDLTYTKPNFIRHLLAIHKKPVLYLDVDCEVMSQPELIDKLVSTRHDFAIYNWFADDECTDCFISVELSPSPNEPPIKNRFYRYLGSEAFFTKKQLKCNGLVQFYGYSVAARALLSNWHRTIATFPRCTDDSALSFTFNNLTRHSWLAWLLKVQWLPKPYARISWWIHTKPVINHADLPSKSSKFNTMTDSRARKQFYHSLMERRKPATHFPEDCIIDTKQHMVCNLVDGELVPIEPTDQHFWL